MVNSNTAIYPTVFCIVGLDDASGNMF